jgi:hypothetical protein
MNRYLIYYWPENNHQGCDLEIIIKADDMEHAIVEFKKQIKAYKSITTITELCYA